MNVKKELKELKGAVTRAISWENSNRDYLQTMINAVRISKGREFYARDQPSNDYFIYKSDNPPKPENAILIGVAHPLKWEIWVEKTEK